MYIQVYVKAMHDFLLDLQYAAIENKVTSISSSTNQQIFEAAGVRI